MSVNLTSIFYPTSSSQVTDPDTAAALFAKQYSESPSIDLIVYFADLILESAPTKPEDVDSLLQVALLMYRNKSLPTIWSDRPKGSFTFDQIFNICLRDEIHSCLSISETSERLEFLNGSFIAGRACGLGLMTSPEILGAVAEGLMFSGETSDNFTGELAEIMALGACLQLLGSATKMIQYSAKRFSVEKFVRSLQGIEINALDRPLVELTICHLRSTPLEDLSSSEIVQSARSVGWNRLWDNTNAPVQC